VKGRKRLYLAMMGTCLTLFVLSWAVVRFYSTTAAVIMSVIAMVIPPLAVVVANNRAEGERWWDE
jgi:ABC-type transport system involved in cytochrome bd biosynthesis fused ATPase/permease subunit